MASLLAILIGLAFPDLQHQWIRFASLEIMPVVKLKPPAVPVLPSTSGSSSATEPAYSAPVAVYTSCAIA